jgi:hypothetical protein
LIGLSTDKNQVLGCWVLFITGGAKVGGLRSDLSGGCYAAAIRM